MKMIEKIEILVLYWVNNKYNPRFKKFKENYFNLPIDEYCEYYSSNQTKELQFYHELLTFKGGVKRFMKSDFNKSVLKEILNQ